MTDTEHPGSRRRKRSFSNGNGPADAAPDLWSGIVIYPAHWWLLS